MVGSITVVCGVSSAGVFGPKAAIDEGQKINESLKAYNDKYERQMSDLNNELNTKHNNELIYQQSEYQRGYDRMSYLEDLLAKEKAERVRSLDE